MASIGIETTKAQAVSQKTAHSGIPLIEASCALAEFMASRPANQANKHVKTTRTIDNCINVGRIDRIMHLKPAFRVLLKWAMPIGTIAIAVLAFCQVQVSRNTAKKQLRAYVLPVQAQLVGINNRFGPLDIRINVRNSGQTPARAMTIEMDVWFEPDEMAKRKTGKGPVKEATPTSLGPSDEVYLERKVEEARRSNIKNRKGVLHVEGMIHYQDIFHENHTSSFHFIQGGEYDPEAPQMGPAQSGNTWD